MVEDKVSFERGMARLDEIVQLLERGETPLDKLLEMFEEGTKLIKTCGKMLDEAEQKVIGLQESMETGNTKEIIFDDE